MRLHFSYILAIFFIILSNFAIAAPSDDLANLLNSTRTMRANFTQTVIDNRNKPVQKSYGTMALSRPGKFRWDVKKPIPQLIVANQPRLWIYDSDLDQVTIRTLNVAAGQTPALLLSQVNTVIDKDFAVKQLSNAQNQITYELIPRNNDASFGSIRLIFNSGKISAMYLQDHLGNTTKIEFSEIEANINIPANTFTFKIPANVDVIDETKK